MTAGARPFRERRGQGQTGGGTDENALLLVLEEVDQCPPRLGVREREGRRQIGDGAPDALSLEGYDLGFNPIGKPTGSRS